MLHSLLLACFLQIPATDLPFRAAVLDFVREATPTDDYRWRGVSPRLALAVETLGANQYRPRLLALQYIREHAGDPGLFEVLLVGSRDADYEVADTCLRLLAELVWCRECLGAGYKVGCVVSGERTYCGTHYVFWRDGQKACHCLACGATGKPK